MKTNLRDEQIWLAVVSLMILACVALALGLSYARGVMIPFVLAVFITITVSPLMDFQETRLKLPHPVAVVGIPGMVQMIIGNVIEPKLLGKGLELHPVTVLLALTFWGLLWGIVGMVLAVPITATIRIVLMRFATTKPIGDLLAGHLPGTSAPSS
ncbi:MAG: AI-2E family transporter [Thermoguttaceae bacterium]